MRREHAPDTVWRCQELYCVDRLSFAYISSVCGVADSTLRRWADLYAWRDKRQEIAKAEADIRANTVLGRSHVLKMLLESDTSKEASQMAFAVAGLEKMAFAVAEAHRAAKALPSEQDIVPCSQLCSQVENNGVVEPLSEEEKIAKLEAGLQAQLQMLLTQPADKISTKIKEIAAGFEVLRKLKGEDKSAGAVSIRFEGDI